MNNFEIIHHGGKTRAGGTVGDSLWWTDFGLTVNDLPGLSLISWTSLRLDGRLIKTDFHESREDYVEKLD